MMDSLFREAALYSLAPGFSVVLKEEDDSIIPAGTYKIYSVDKINRTIRISYDNTPGNTCVSFDRIEKVITPWE